MKKVNQSLINNLVVRTLKYGLIKTTYKKAKILKPVLEKIIFLSKQIINNRKKLYIRFLNVIKKSKNCLKNVRVIKIQSKNGSRMAFIFIN